MGSDEVYLEPSDANFYPGAFYIGIYTLTNAWYLTFYIGTLGYLIHVANVASMRMHPSTVKSAGYAGNWPASMRTRTLRK